MNQDKKDKKNKTNNHWSQNGQWWEPNYDSPEVESLNSETKETKVSNPGWACKGAKVYDSARMYYGEAKVFGDDRDSKAADNVWVSGMLRCLVLFGCAVVLGGLVLFGFIN